MTRVQGSAALRLNFDGGTTPTLRPAGRGNGRLHLASSGARAASDSGAAGHGKYRELERRRRAAQIKARHLLTLMGEE